MISFAICLVLLVVGYFTYGKFVEKDRNGKVIYSGHYESGRRFND